MYCEKHNEHKERNQDNVKKVVKNAVIYLGVIKITIYVHTFCFWRLGYLGYLQASKHSDARDGMCMWVFYNIILILCNLFMNF